MNRQIALVCLAAVAFVGCATADLIQPPPLASCDATNDCPLPDSGADATTDGPAAEAAADTGSDVSAVDASEAGTPDAGDGGSDADAKG